MVIRGGGGGRGGDRGEWKLDVVNTGYAGANGLPFLVESHFHSLYLSGLRTRAHCKS